MPSSFFVDYPVSGDVGVAVDNLLKAAEAAAERAEAAADRAESVQAPPTTAEMNQIKADCIAARDAAVAAKTAAETAKAGAETAQSAANTHKLAAEAAQALAQTASGEAAGYRDQVLEAVAQADNHANSAETAATEASAAANAAAGSATTAAAEVTRLADIVRRIAGIAINDLATASAGDYALQASDKFATIHRSRSDIDAIVLPLGWHTSPSDDGRPSVAWCRVYNRHSSEQLEIKVPPAANNKVTVTSRNIGTWRTALANGADETAKQVTFDFTAPAGTNRKVAVQLVGSLATRTDPGGAGQRFFGISSVSGGATGITKALTDTAPGGHKDLAPRQTHAGWTFSLPDSPSAATQHTITFDFPADQWNAIWSVTVTKDCQSVAITGASDTTLAAIHDRSVTTAADGCAIALHHGFVGGDGGPMGSNSLPANTYGQATTATGTATGGADSTSFYCHTDATTAGTYNYHLEWSAQAKESSYSFAVFTPAAGQSAVSIVGDGDGSVMIPAGGAAEVEALSSGNTYFVRLL